VLKNVSLMKLLCRKYGVLGERIIRKIMFLYIEEKLLETVPRACSSRIHTGIPHV